MAFLGADEWDEAQNAGVHLPPSGEYVKIIHCYDKVLARVRSFYLFPVRVDQMSLIDTCRILMGYVKYDPECIHRCEVVT